MEATKPTREQLLASLKRAASSHHQFETVKLAGERDEQWAGFYAAYVLGQLGDFVAPSDLSVWLEEAPSEGDWPQSATTYVFSKLP